MIAPKKDVQTTTASGEPILDLIEGVRIRPATPLADERGTLCEILNPAWALHEAPIVYVYQFTIRPGKIKGWHQHHLHDDRIFLSQGTVKVVLYDDRPDSPTYRKVNEICRTEHQRTIMVIPAFVYHAHQNIGHTEALFVSMPTRAYNHADPDVFRLPLGTDYIPYQFEGRPGW
ncbi:MAG: cupin domain-containing protein [Chthoniobacterales bacterium]